MYRKSHHLLTNLLRYQVLTILSLELYLGRYVFYLDDFILVVFSCSEEEEEEEEDGIWMGFERSKK